MDKYSIFFYKGDYASGIPDSESAVILKHDEDNKEVKFFYNLFNNLDNQEEFLIRAGIPFKKVYEYKGTISGPFLEPFPWQKTQQQIISFDEITLVKLGYLHWLAEKFNIEIITAKYNISVTDI